MDDGAAAARCADGTRLMSDMGLIIVVSVEARRDICAITIKMDSEEFKSISFGSGG